MVKDDRRLSMTAVMVSITFVIAVVALALSIVAYQQSGMGIDEKIAVTMEEDRAELRRELAVADARLTLLAIRTEMAAGQATDVAADEIADARESLEGAYEGAESAARESWREMDASLDAAEVSVREGGADALSAIVEALSTLRGNIDVSYGDLCREDGGEWKEFPNACADRCGTGPVCAQVMVESCDCGPGRCWNGAACEPA